MINKILRKNTSAGRIIGFVLSNFIGLAIVLGGLQFYGDASSIWTDEDSFIKSDYMVINKKVTGANTLGQASTGFSDDEISDLESQKWVRSVGRFTSNDFRVYASVRQAGRGMSTYMFFEAIPDEFIDVPKSKWSYRPESGEVPIILSKDYLTLYNFGFASSAGLPQLSEGVMGSVPLELVLTSDDGTRQLRLNGRVAGFSNRLNTILVPQEFMNEANATLGRPEVVSGAEKREPSRLIVDVSSPGDVAIKDYLEEHDLEVGGDKSASSAAFLLKVVIGIVLAIGTLITVLSLFILILSVSLIMEKNRDKLHSVLMLGYPPGEVARPYIRLVAGASAVALLLAYGAVFALRAYYMTSIEGLGARPGSVWIMLLTGLVMTAVIVSVNVIAVRRRVVSAWR